MTERTDAADRRAVTLKDIAEASGVSISTVSRILDDRTPPSKSVTAQRVRALADEMGYRRNLFASHLRRGATATIGVLVPRLTDAVMALMFEAVERTARQRGYFAVVATAGDDPEDERLATETLLDRNVDGVILATARLDDSLPASLRERGVPHVLALRTDRVSPSALGDDDAGGYLAVRHMLDLGHTDIGIVAGPAFTSSGIDRLGGAERALAEAGRRPGDGRVVSVGYGLDHGIEAGHALLDRSDRPTAVFAANDNLAIGVLTVAATLGLTPGRDLSIVGYNDIPLVSKLPVPLTSVRTPFPQIASAAVDLLLTPPESGERLRRVLPTLIPRASTSRV